MLPAFFAPTGVTIVIAPLILLQHDLLRRCNETGINAKLWNGSGTKYTTPESIVLITPESATTNAFFNYLNFLKSQHQLDRVVLDECHMLLSWNDTFRKKMADTFELVKSGCCQLVLLTATLPISYEKELFDLLKITDTFTIFRDSTTRKNISYGVRTISGYNYFSELEHIVENEFDETFGKCIIYVRNIALGEEVSQKMNIDFFHSRAVGKAQMYRKWLESDKREVIVATNALGCGVDVSNIRCVIHLGSPRALIDFAQESGRAGRDGLPAKSILLHLETFNFSMDDDMAKYITQCNDCRRCQLDIVMDGHHGRQSCYNDENNCDVCAAFENECAHLDVDEILRTSTSTNNNHIQFLDNKNDNAVTEGHVILVREEHQKKKARIDVRHEVSVDVECKHMMEQFTISRCMVCAITCTQQCTSIKEHEQLTKLANNQAAAFMKKYRNNRVQLPKFVVCFTCLSPQQWWFDNNNGKCNHEHSNTMLTAIYIVALLDKSFADEHFYENEYMLETIGRFGTMEKALRLTKVFYETINLYRARNDHQVGIT